MTDALTRCCEELIRMGEKLHAVTAERDEAIEALRAASGYFLNAKISLEVGTKRSGIDLIEGGLRVVQAILAKHAKGEERS